MATRFYLHAATTEVAGTLPSGEQGAGAASVSFANSTTLRKMNSLAGVAQTSVTATSAASVSAQRALVGMWVSLPLAAQNIAADTWTFNIAAAENNTNANFWPNLVNLYVWRPSTGAAVGTILDASNSASLGGAEPGAANSERVVTFTFSGGAVNGIQAGDVLVCEVWSVFTQGNATARTLTAYFDGTTVNTTANAVVTDQAAFIEHPGTITQLPATTAVTASVVLVKEGSRAVTVRAIGPGADVSPDFTVVYSPASSRTSDTTASVSLQGVVSANVTASTSIQSSASSAVVASVVIAQGSAAVTASTPASVSVQGPQSASVVGSVSIRDALSASTTASVSIQTPGSANTTASVVLVGGTLRTVTARAIGPGADVSPDFTFQHAMLDQGTASAVASVSVQGAQLASTPASVSVLGEVSASTTASVVVQGQGTQRVVTLRAIGPGADVSTPVSLTYNVQATLVSQVVASVSIQAPGSAQTQASVAVSGSLAASVSPSVSIQGGGSASAVASVAISATGLGFASTTASVTIAPVYGVYDVNVQPGQRIDLGAPFVVTGFVHPYVGVEHAPGDGVYIRSVRITIDSTSTSRDAPVQANGAFSVNIGS